MSNPNYLDPNNAGLEMTEDALFDKGLYVGTGQPGEENEQFEVRARFSALDQKIDEGLGAIPDDIEEINAVLNEHDQRITEAQQTAETGIEDAKAAQTTADTARTEAATAKSDAATVQANLTNHANNAAAHMPSGGLEGDVLTVGAQGNPLWQNFLNLLPPEIWTIIENGGQVTPEQVIEAFQQITVSQWQSSGRPIAGGYVDCSLFLFDRFFVGGDTGTINYAYDSKTWRGELPIFTEPEPPSLVETIKGVALTDGSTIVLALDAYSDYRVSTDRFSFGPRMSVQVKTDADGNYLDRYDVPDFTAAVMDRDIVCLFTSSGKVYRTTYTKLIAEYTDGMAAMNEPPEEGEDKKEFDRHSKIWELQTSQDSITKWTLDAAAGGDYLIAVGALGNIAYSTLGKEWFQVQPSVFGSSNINAIAAGEDRWIAVSNEGKIGYALFSDPTAWRLVEGSPFGTENLTAIHYASGMWLIGSASGKIMMSKTGLTWKTLDAGFTKQITSIAFGDTYFMVSDNAGNVRSSLSVSSLLTLVTRAEFAQLADSVLGMTAQEIAKVQAFIDEQLARVNEALAKQLKLSDSAGLPSTFSGTPGSLEIDVPVLDNDGNPVLDEDGNPVTETKPNVYTLANDHTHSNINEALQDQIGSPTYRDTQDVPGNKKLDGNHLKGFPSWDQAVYLSQLDRATQELPTDPVAYWYAQHHYQGIPVLDKSGKLYAKNQTWQRGEANGIAPLDENAVIPEEYLRAGWAYETMIQAIRDQMLLFWTIQPTSAFQDLGEYSRINDIAYDATTIVAVGEKGRIAWGPNVRQMQIAENSPFGANDSVLGVAHGTRSDGAGIFVAVTKTHYSTSTNGEVWTEAVELSQDLQGVFFGGGFFLIPDAVGNIWRSQWDGEHNLTFLEQETSPTITQGVLSIAFLQGKFVGVGAGNKIVGTTDPTHWIEEQSPNDADTQYNCVFAGNGFFVTAGSKGRAAIGSISGSWETVKTNQNNDLHYGFFDGGTYLIMGKNGTLLTSFSATSWTKRTSKTTATIRSGGYKNERFFVGTDAGQFITSASVYDVLMLVDDGTGSGPSNDEPLPPSDPPTPGIKNTYSRGDHQHPPQDMPEGSDNNPLPLAEQAKPGESDDFARADHEHPMDGVIPEPQKGVPNGVAPLDGNNLVPKPHIPPMDISELLNALKANLEFSQVISPFPQGEGTMSVIHAGCAIGEHLALGGEAGIGWSNGGVAWQMVDNQPFDKTVAGMVAGLDHNNEMLAFAIDTDKSYSTSRDLIEWSEKVSLDGNYDFSWIAYHNKQWVITSTNGQILRTVWNGTGYDIQEQEVGPEFTEGLVRVIGGNNQWIGFGIGGRLRLSDDASHFEPLESPTTKDLYCGDYGNGIFVIGGQDGTLIYCQEEDAKIGLSPFDNGEDLLAISYIKSHGLFMATNRIGEIAVTEHPTTPWKSLKSPFAVPVRAIAESEKIISIGTDQGEIASSRKVIEINIDSGCNVVGIGKAANDGDIITANLIDRNVEGTGERIENIIMLPRAASRSLHDTVIDQWIIENPNNGGIEIE